MSSLLSPSSALDNDAFYKGRSPLKGIPDLCECKMVFQLSLPSAHLHIEKRANSVCLWKKCVYLGQREHLVFKSCSDFVIGSEQQGGFILDPAGAQGSKEHKTVVV